MTKILLQTWDKEIYENVIKENIKNKTYHVLISD